MSVSRSARLLFIGLWTFADDCGNGSAKLRELKMKVFPGDSDVTPAKIEKWLNELNKELIIIYNVEDKQYYHVMGWGHQLINNPSKAKYPAFSEDYRRTTGGLGTLREGIGREGKGKDRKGKEAATEVPATFIELARTFLEKQKERFPKESALKDFEARVTAGARNLHLFHTEDNWTEDELRDLLDWVPKDEFWSAQIRSLGSIRSRKKGAGSPMKFENAKASMERSSAYIEEAEEKEVREQTRQEALERHRESERATAEAATPEEAQAALRSDAKAREMLEGEGG